MAGQGKAIRSRIKSVRNTKKITKAMELVSASKVRRVVSRTVAVRPYIEHSLDIIHAIKSPVFAHPLLTETKGTKVLIVVITSDKGLCGGYNAQLLRTLNSFITAEAEQCEFVTIGKKGDAALRQNNSAIVASFDHKAASHEYADIIADYCEKVFLRQEYKKVYVAYTQYVSALLQEPHVTQLLPFADLSDTSATTAAEQVEYLFEPGAETILDIVVEKIINAQLYGMLLESAASEESARMIAMKNASDAAGEMISDLSLTYNKIRQAAITQEISEISAGMTSTQ